MAENTTSKKIICPICETAVLQNVDLCPECSWEIDRLEEKSCVIVVVQMMLGTTTDLRMERMI